MTTLPTFQPMDTAPEATRENPVVLYYQHAGVVPFAERSGKGWGYRARQWRADDPDVLNFVLEKPLGWMPMETRNDKTRSLVHCPQDV